MVHCAMLVVASMMLKGSHRFSEDFVVSVYDVAVFLTSSTEYVMRGVVKSAKHTLNYGNRY